MTGADFLTDRDMAYTRHLVWSFRADSSHLHSNPDHSRDDNTGDHDRNPYTADHDHNHDHNRDDREDRCKTLEPLAALMLQTRNTKSRPRRRSLP